MAAEVLMRLSRQNQKRRCVYSEEWGGLPDKEFLAMLDPKLAPLRDRLYERAYGANTPAGGLCTEWAQKLAGGHCRAIGEFDVHYGAIDSGVEEGVL
jgi:L-ribulokinase